MKNLWLGTSFWLSRKIAVVRTHGGSTVRTYFRMHLFNTGVDGSHFGARTQIIPDITSFQKII